MTNLYKKIIWQHYNHPQNHGKLKSPHQEFEGKNKELQDLQMDFQAKQRTLNPQALTQMERQIEQKQLELRRFQEDAQAELSQRQNALLQGISEKSADGK